MGGWALAVAGWPGRFLCASRSLLHFTGLRSSNTQRQIDLKLTRKWISRPTLAPIASNYLGAGSKQNTWQD
eukprot:905905-Amphidinium_carterae.1